VKAIDERIGELVAAHRPQLEQLVRQAVDRELKHLVDAELKRRANGNGAAATTRLCSECGERPAAKHRKVCEGCRHARMREQQTPAAEAEPPRPGRDSAG
jgi:hypothetical protein